MTEMWQLYTHTVPNQYCAKVMEYFHLSSFLYQLLISLLIRSHLKKGRHIFGCIWVDTIPYSMKGMQKCQVPGNIKKQKKIDNSLQLTFSQFLSPVHMFREGFTSSQSTYREAPSLTKPELCFHGDCKYRQEDN